MSTHIESHSLASITIAERRVHEVAVSPELCNELTQVRKTYHIEHDLVPSFLARGQLSKGMVAVLDQEQAQVYVETVNQIFSSTHTLANLRPMYLDGELRYLVIFAGHRRHRTVLHLNRGIAEGIYEPSENFDGKYRADLHFDITAKDAIELQFHENRYSSPLPQEEADAAWRYFRYLKAEEDLSPGQFARRIGRTPEWIRSAFRFCALPESVQSYVVGDNPARITLPYTALVELARLVEGYRTITSSELSEQGMHAWVREAVAGQLKSTTFGRKVSNYLEDLRQQQLGQFSLFDLSESEEEHQRRIRRTVAKEMVPGLWRFMQYARQVERLRENGQLGGESYLGPYTSAHELEQFSPGSPIRVLAESADLIEQLMPHLAEIAKREKTGHYRKLSRKHVLVQEIAGALKHLARYEERAAGTPAH